MTDQRQELWSDAKRWPLLITVVPYLLLGALTICTIAIKYEQWGSLRIDLILCGLAAVWMLWLFTLHPAWRTRSSIMVVFFTGLIIIMAILVIRDPWFGFLTPAGYFFAFRLLPRPWLLPGVAAVAAVAGTAQAYGLPKNTVLGFVGYLAVLAVNVLPMSAFVWFTWRSAKQNDQRNQALQEVSEANRKLEVSLSENAALHQQLLAQAREAGVFDERQRMAREIHDTLAQGLTGIITQLQAAEHAGAQQQEWQQQDWQRHIDAATRLARESLIEARRSVHALRPEPLETARISEALTDVAERWSKLHKIPVQVTTTGTVRPMHPEAEVALLRTTQEALANIAKHAQASRVGVTLSYLENEVALDVRDDGRGFDPDNTTPSTDSSANGSGFGLIAMRQRVEALSGVLQVESEPGSGTAISARIPATTSGLSS
jgi:signal transduction histidine kinase